MSKLFNSVARVYQEFEFKSYWEQILSLKNGGFARYLEDVGVE